MLEASSLYSIQVPAGGWVGKLDYSI